MKALFSIPGRFLIILLFLISRSGFGQIVYTVETVPNVKLITNSYVSNPDSILTEATVYTINSKLGDLERKTSVQVAVVAVRSIGYADIFNFAQELFNTWGIGQAKKDNGLLILLVTDQKTVRFHTGYGLEGVLPDAVCKQIQIKSMVPSFKEGDYDQGISNGIDDVISVLSDPKYHTELMDDSRREAEGWDEFFMWALFGGGGLILLWYLILNWNAYFEGTPDRDIKKQLHPNMKMNRIRWLLIFGFGPVMILLFFQFRTIGTWNHILTFLLFLYAYLAFTLLYKRLRVKSVTDKLASEKKYFAAAAFLNDYQISAFVMAILFPLPGLFFYLQYNATKRYFRNHPRNCKSCGQPAEKLGEAADDQYLEKSQVFEENLKSVDYDVWLCKSCHSKEVLNFTNRFSKYEPCPYCKTKAFHTESRRTVVEPTYESSGTGEQTDRCKFCHKKKVTTYSIAKLTRSDSSSGGSSDGGGGGGSWGGGSSGGGGASSSW